MSNSPYFEEGGDGNAAASVLASIKTSAAGAMQLAAWTTPVAAGGTALSSTLAANSATNALTGLSNPAVPMVVEATFGAGWDGGNIVITGTFNGALQTDTITASAGSTVAGVKPFTTITSAVKTAVGASTATVQLFNTAIFGLVPAPVSTQGLPIVLTTLAAFEAALSSFAISTANSTVVFHTAPSGTNSFLLLYQGAIGLAHQ